MRKKIYLNKKQLLFGSATQKEKVLIAGRGFGKTTQDGVESYVNIIELPRSKGFFLGLTYNQILTKFLPPIMGIWESMGLVEQTNGNIGHYIVGKQPPSNWQRPYQPPKNYSNVISFCNGSCIEMISFDRRDHARGGNYDWGIVDEAALLDKGRFDKEIRASVRGNVFQFKGHHRHHSIVYTTSMPWLQSGMWVPDMKEQAKKQPDEVFYLEGTAYDNIDVLGEGYLRRLKNSLPDLVFRVEVLNERITRLNNAFYDQFSEQKHGYTDAFLYSDNDEQPFGCLISDADYVSQLPLCLSMDFGARFTCAVVAQEVITNKETVLRFINNFYSKESHEPTDGSIIERCVQQFIDKYRGHKAVVELWGDRNGNNRVANSQYTFFEQIERQLTKAGFSVEMKVPRSLDPLHHLKHYTINRMLSESDAQTPRIRINLLRCKEMVISIQAAPVTIEFKKDKSSEQEDIPQERATHLSDAFDCLVYRKYHGLVETGGDVFSSEFL